MLEINYQEKSRRDILFYRAKILSIKQDNPHFNRIISGEISRCKNDFWHWLTHWCYTRDEDKKPGTSPLKLFPHKLYLKVLADLYQEPGMLLVLKTRQIMASWVSLLFSLWQVLYHPGMNILVQAKDERDAILFLERIDHTYQHLPEFLKHPKAKQIQLQFQCKHYEGSSQLLGLPLGADKVRSQTVSYYFGDEAAFNPELKGCVTAVSPGLGSYGKLVLISTAGFSYFWDLYEDKPEKGKATSDEYLFHEQEKLEYQEIAKGIETWINARNKLRVLKLHYTADPEKDPARDGAEWYRNKKENYLGDWEKEMEMNPFSALGQRVYSDVFTKDHIIEDFEIPKHWNRVMALDYGNVVPTACLWAAISPEGKVYFYREYYQAGLDVDTHCDNIRILEGWKPREEGEEKVNWHVIQGSKWLPRTEDIRIRLIDPATDHEARKDVPTLYKVFNSGRNSMGFVKAQNALNAGIERCKNLLQARDENGAPMVYFFRSLRHFFYEINNYRYQTQTELVAARKDLSEKPLDKDDHEMDCFRYLVITPGVLRYYEASQSNNEDVDRWEPTRSAYKPYKRNDGFTTGYC